MLRQVGPEPGQCNILGWPVPPIFIGIMTDKAFKVGDMVRIKPAPERGRPGWHTIGLIVQLHCHETDWSACEVQYQDESDNPKISWFYVHELCHV